MNGAINFGLEIKGVAFDFISKLLLFNLKIGFLKLIYIKQNRIEKACEDLQEAKNLGFQQEYGNEILILMKKNCK